MPIARRTLLKVGGALLLATVPLPLLFRRSERAKSIGPLIKDPAGLLDLPEAFAYQVIDETGEPMSDGYRVPGRPDGMACFVGSGNTLVLMRNHELDVSPVGAAYDTNPPSEAYDPTVFGGVTRVVIDSKTLKRVSSNLVLTGTLRNCAGGSSPWGWLSCEEAIDTGHGYVFRCRPDANTLSAPERIVGYGRFRHEAVCVDPQTLIAYLTEDQPDGCLYRFVPTAPSQPWEGKLQAMRVRASPGFDTATHMKSGEKLEIDWIDITDADPETDAVRTQAHQQGAANVRRGEGIFWHEGAVYFSSTNGGALSKGQIFRLTPGAGNRAASLELLAESEDPDLLDGPDNICVAPWGDVYIAEDGEGEQFIRVLTKNGKFADLARNAASTGEFAGVCFDPLGKVLFANMFGNGVTLAITGPFRDIGAG